MKDIKPITPTSSQTNSIKYISQDALTAFVKEGFIVVSNKKANRPFNLLHYNKVIAYDYDSENGESNLNIVENNRLVLKIKKQKQLNQKQVDQLTDLLGSNSTYGNTYAFCFVPHLGIVFYYNDKIIMSVSISIGCNFLNSSVPIPATKAKYIEIDKDYKYPAEGFSKKGRLRFILLAKDLKFSI
ncbi:MAG TPA: hypothetical protein VGN20_18025 [Mucilaginibacter sp.]